MTDFQKRATDAARDTFPPVCDSDRAGSSVLHRDLIWQPPEVLFPCSACNATGQYVGFLEVEKGKVSGGRKVVKA
jgi:hypothetical protein